MESGSSIATIKGTSTLNLSDLSAYQFVLRLNQTLDAIPSPILTPYTGAFPPSYLLDKIAFALTLSITSPSWLLTSNRFLAPRSSK